MSLMRTLPTPTPALGADFYHQNLTMRLSTSRVAKENYEKYLQSSKRDISPEYRPIKIDIEPVSRCNFSCTMCVVSTWEKGARARDLSIENFRSILHSEPQIVEIKLQGLGEPLMAGENLFEMIRIARAEHIWVRTTTNASLLHLNRNFVELIDSKVCEIQVSIDGSQANTFSEIRVGSKPKRIFENCVKLNTYASQVGWNCTKMWTVVQSKNVSELEELVSTAANLGFKTQCFAIDLHGWGLEDWNDRNNGVKVLEEELATERLLNLVRIGEMKGVRVEFWQNSTKYSTSQPDKLCPWPFERTMISSDMRVTPCCMISNPETLEIGRSYSESSWDSQEYRGFREEHLSGKIPQACQGCYEY